MADSDDIVPASPVSSKKRRKTRKSITTVLNSPAAGTSKSTTTVSNAAENSNFSPGFLLRRKRLGIPKTPRQNECKLDGMYTDIIMEPQASIPSDFTSSVAISESVNILKEPLATKSFPCRLPVTQNFVCMSNLPKASDLEDTVKSNEIIRGLSKENENQPIFTDNSKECLNVDNLNKYSETPTASKNEEPFKTICKEKEVFEDHVNVNSGDEMDFSQSPNVIKNISKLSSFYSQNKLSARKRKIYNLEEEMYESSDKEMLNNEGPLAEAEILENIQEILNQNAEFIGFDDNLVENNLNSNKICELSELLEKKSAKMQSIEQESKLICLEAQLKYVLRNLCNQKNKASTQKPIEKHSSHSKGKGKQSHLKLRTRKRNSQKNIKNDSSKREDTKSDIEEFIPYLADNQVHVNPNTSPNTEIWDDRCIKSEFKTASGKNMYVSAKSIKRSVKLFYDIYHERDPSQEKEKLITTGFVTANNTEILVSEKTYLEQAKIFDDINLDEWSEMDWSQNNPKSKNHSTANCVSNEKIQTNLTAHFSGYKTAIEKPDLVPEKLLQKDSKISVIDEFTCNISSKLNEKTVSTGFSTASGKPIFVSEKSLEKSKKLIQDILKEYDQENEESGVPLVSFKHPIEKPLSIPEKSIQNTSKLSVNKMQENFDFRTTRTPCNISSKLNEKTVSTGFSTASGNPIFVSEKSLEKSKKLIQDIMKEYDQENEESGVPLVSFKPPIEKLISIPDKSIQSPSKLSGNKMQENFDFKTTKTPCNISSKLNEKTVSTGFSTASGKPIFVSEKSLEKSKQLIQDIMKEYDQENEESGVPLVSFKPPTEKPMSIPDKSIQNTSKLSVNKMQENFDFKTTKTPCNISSKLNEKTVSTGFSTASEKPIFVSEKSLEKSKKLIEDIMKEYDQKYEENRVPSVGFKTPNEKPISISDKSIQSASKLLKDKMQKDFDTKTDETSCNMSSNLNDKTIISGFTTASGGPIFVSEKSVQKASKIFEDIVHEDSNEDWSFPANENVLKETFKIDQNKMSKMYETGFRTGLGKPILVSEKSFFKGTKLFDDILQEEMEEITGLQSRKENILTSNKTTDELANLNSKNCQLSNVLHKSNTTACTVTKKCMNPSSSGLSNGTKFNENIKKFCNKSESKPHSSLIIPQYIKINRQFALSKQKNRIKTPLKTPQQRSGSLYLKKLVSKPKIHLKDLEMYTDHARQLEILNRNEIIDICDFKFNMTEYYDKEVCEENTNGIPMRDDMILIMDGNCQCGYDEICSSFLDSPYVDSKCIPNGWIENHLHWIISKLFSMDKILIKLTQPLLTPENVLLQLKYRYDRDVIRSEKSIIRKILEYECDAAVPMILFLTKFHRKEGVHLSDGWYSIPVELDSILLNAFHKGIISIGTKLIIQCAELIGSTGPCSPLKESENIKLKIYANATRRVHFNSKLGITKSFRIKLKDIKAFGGTVGLLRVCVLKMCPVTQNEKEEKEWQTTVRNHVIDQRIDPSIDNRPNKLLNIEVTDPTFESLIPVSLIINSSSNQISANLLCEQQLIEISHLIPTKNTQNELQLHTTSKTQLTYLDCDKFEMPSWFNRSISPKI